MNFIEKEDESMKIITHKNIVDLNISPSQCVEWVKEVFKIKNQCYLPSKISMKEEGNIFYNIMPCIIGDLNATGVKVVSRYPNRKPSLDSEIMLYDNEEGRLCGILDGNWITTMRTGAVATLAISQLAKKDFKNVSIVGLGNTGRATIDCLLSYFPDKEINLKLMRYKDQAEAFATRYEKYKNVNIEIVDDMEKLIRNAEVIISCMTFADKLLGKDEWFDEGVLVVPVHTRGFQNCDLFFDKVVADDESHVCEFQYFDKFKNFRELADVINGVKAGREGDSERILAYNIGIALHDIYFANKIYKMLDDKIESIDLQSPTDKLWI